MARSYEKHYEHYDWYDVYYCGRFLSATYAASEEKAINNVRYTQFLSQYEWADWEDFEAVPQKPKKPIVSQPKKPEEEEMEINLDYFINKKKEEQKAVPHWEQASLFDDGGGR